MFPDAPHITRPGQINAWDNEDFVQAIKDTGRKQLLIAGVITDASGTFNEAVRHAAWARMAAAGAQLVGWFSVASELHRDWRNDVEGLGNLLSNHVPNYRNLMTSYAARQKMTRV
jgi:hypothetical protein